jgi:hypothetical protein
MSARILCTLAQRLAQGSPAAPFVQFPLPRELFLWKIVVNIYQEQEKLQIAKCFTWTAWSVCHTQKAGSIVTRQSFTAKQQFAYFIQKKPTYFLLLLQTAWHCSLNYYVCLPACVAWCAVCRVGLHEVCKDDISYRLLLPPNVLHTYVSCSYNQAKKS